MKSSVVFCLSWTDFCLFQKLYFYQLQSFLRNVWPNTWHESCFSFSVVVISERRLPRSPLSWPKGSSGRKKRNTVASQETLLFSRMFLWCWFLPTEHNLWLSTVWFGLVWFITSECGEFLVLMRKESSSTQLYCKKELFGGKSGSNWTKCLIEGQIVNSSNGLISALLYMQL